MPGSGLKTRCLRPAPVFSASSPAIAVLLSLVLSQFSQMAFGAERGRWEEMEYGPYLTASIEAPEPRTNIAYKGIAMNLGANFGGDHNEAIAFDTDLLRYSAGW